MHLYYELTTVSVVANAYNVNLILNIPLKPANRYFTLFKIITLPVRVFSDKFVQYSVDYSYIGLQHNQQAYILFTETGFNRCKRGTFTICSADVAVYNEQALKCEISLYSQAKDTHRLCRRKVLLNPQTPFLHRYGTLWV
jgi:hypothetical protein